MKCVRARQQLGTPVPRSGVGCCLPVGIGLLWGARCSAGLSGMKSTCFAHLQGWFLVPHIWKKKLNVDQLRERLEKKNRNDQWAGKLDWQRKVENTSSAVKSFCTCHQSSNWKMLLQRVRICWVWSAPYGRAWNGGKWWLNFRNNCFYNSCCRSRKASNARSGCKRSVLSISVLLSFGKRKSNPRVSGWFWMHHFMPALLMLEGCSASSQLVRAVPSSPAPDPWPKLVLQTGCRWFACVQEICCCLPNWWTNSQFNMQARISRLENGDDNRRKRTEIH